MPVLITTAAHSRHGHSQPALLESSSRWCSQAYATGRHQILVQFLRGRGRALPSPNSLGSQSRQADPTDFWRGKRVARQPSEMLDRTNLWRRGYYG